MEVLAVALRLGLTSFGGPIAHLGYFRREYVERRRWLGEVAYADTVALGQFLPGPASSQVGIAVGVERAGLGGGLAAWIGFTLPSALVMAFLGLGVAGGLLPGGSWVDGLKLAAVAVVAHAVWSMAASLTPDVPRAVLALAAAAVALAFPSPFTQVALIVVGAAAGLVILSRLGVVTAPAGDPEPGPPAPAAVAPRVAVAALGLFAILLAGLPLLHAATGQPAIAFVEAFYRAGALVFGGGHVVLPLLEATVVAPGWVTNDAFLAGYGAAQALPGPLFAFAAYLGAAASGPVPGGIPGALLATIAIFLPGALLVVGALPFWHALRARPGARAALVGVNAAVVGILAAALIDPVARSGISAPADLAVAAAGFAALLTGRVPPLAVVGGSVAAAVVLGPAGF
ncbi:MAG: chromate efflux transporter [Chloroflexi bacterium]|nr:chromate efflux transporter [Chloroflexota bacterium]